jgi:hypothetical protein
MQMAWYGLMSRLRVSQTTYVFAFDVPSQSSISTYLTILVLACLGQTGVLHVSKSSPLNTSRFKLASPRVNLCSILARPHYYTGNQFSIGITGHNFDPADLIEPAKLTQFIHAETGRTELEFGKFTSLTYFK